MTNRLNQSKFVGLLLSAIMMLAISSCGGSSVGESVGQVDPVVASVAISPDAWNADRGQQQQLTATAFNASGYPIPGVQFTWESSATDVALVDADGNVTVQFLGGSTDVTATADGKVGATTVTVEPVASVTVSPDTWNANRIGQRQLFTAAAFDALGGPLPGVQFAWDSNATDVARVDANGNAIAHKAGRADITATGEGETATAGFSVTSEIPSQSISGIVYTVWFARSDDAPALLVDGMLEVLEDIYCQNNAEDWVVCPAGVDFVNGTNDRNNDPDYKDEYPNPPDPTTPWSYPDVAKFQWQGDRVGILSDMLEAQGTFRVLDRHEEWRTLAIGNVSDFQLENDRLGIIVDNGALAVIDRDNVQNTAPYGPICFDNPAFPRFSDEPEICLPAPVAWTTLVASGVQKFLLNEDYIGVLLDDGTLRIRNGINGDWIKQEFPGHGFEDFEMETVVTFEERCVIQFPVPTFCTEVPVGLVLRVGVMLDNGDFLVKDDIDGDWSSPEAGAQQFQLTRSFIGLLGEDGTLRVKEGIDGGWALDIHNIKEFGMERRGLLGRDVRIGAILSNGDYLVMDGINGEWRTVASGVQQMQLQENYIGALFDDDSFGVKEGINGKWRRYDLGTGIADKVTQFRLVVDTPVPPSRTWPGRFNHRVQECRDQNDRNLNGDASISHCYPKRLPPLGVGTSRPGVASYYGRFAGKANPGADGWEDAIERGPMDPMDALTLHHDSAYKCPCIPSDPEPSVGWYHETDEEDGTFYLCVVRYGLENALLTKNGRSLDKRERDNWGGLEDLYGTIYFGVTSFWEGAIGIFGCQVNTNFFTGEITRDDLTPFTNRTKARHNN